MAGPGPVGARRGRGTTRAWLWVAVTASVTVLLVRLSRARKVLADPIPGGPGVLTTGRHPAHDHLPVGRRQVRWAHLRRDSQAMIDRRNEGAAAGDELLPHAAILLGQWKRVRFRRGGWHGGGTCCRLNDNTGS